MRLQPTMNQLSDCRVAHQRIYAVEQFDGENWVELGELIILEDAVLVTGQHVHTIDYSGANHSLQLRGRADDPSFRARLYLTECGTGFVGTLESRGEAPRAIRGVTLENTFRTERRPALDPNAPFIEWVDFRIRSEWIDEELKIQYFLGKDDISDRVRVTHVDRFTGETTLEMPPELAPPFRENQFLIVLRSGSRRFDGSYTSEDGEVCDWRGSSITALAASDSGVFQRALSRRAAALAGVTPTATLSLQDLDNISSIEVVTDQNGQKITIDHAQAACGTYFNKCLVNALEKKYVDGIYGHPYALPDGVSAVFKQNEAFFKNNAVLGTGQMLYDNLGSNPLYSDLIKRIRPEAMEAVWRGMGDTPDTALPYQNAASALYIEGYRDAVHQMRPYLEDDPERWAEKYLAWLSDDANLLTWQLQVASKMFDNVRTRMYEWYVKLEVLAPNKDYGQRFMTIAYAALLGVNYSKSQWSEDLQPFLHSLIQQAIAGKVDPEIMDQVQQQAAQENQELLRTLITTQDEITSFVDGISAAITAYQLKKGRASLQNIANDPEIVPLVEEALPESQQKAWSQLSRKGKAGAILGMLFYGATAGFLIFSIADNAKRPLTPKEIIEELNMGILSLAILVKGVQKMMSLGVGRFLENFSKAGEGGAFRTFAADLSLWFKEGGKIVPEGRLGRAFVAMFGDNATSFMARRIGPAMALAGLVLSAALLADSIQSGVVLNIVFETLNTLFALAEVALIGLELLSVGWAGPVGLAVAAIGIIVILIQFIWTLVDPPDPPADPVTEFVDGPMVNKGFATAR